MITIGVRGIPAPQGSKRHVGGGRMVESSKAVGPWRDAVRTETQRVMQDHHMMADAVKVEIIVSLPRPKGHYRTGRNAHLLRDAAPSRPAGVPDVDKLARAILDGLTAGGAWKDDSQVVDLAAAKFYCKPGEAAGAMIYLLDPEE
jgi:Holliday junction resolvase RusA-like endonuclease